MAGSLAEAFKQAEALRAERAKAASPIVACPAADPSIDGQRQDLWAQEKASIEPLQGQTDEALTIESVTGQLSAAIPPAASLSAGGAAVAKHRSRVKSGKARNANLEEYYQRAAAVAASQKPVGQSSPRYNHLRPARAATGLPALPEQDNVSLTVLPDARVAWNYKSAQTAALLCRDSGRGRQSQLSTKPDGMRDVVLGFDFGTSSAKVVIGDRNLRKAHAVPFCDAIGIEAYLLPATLYERDGIYSLHEGALRFDDLKLALLADHNDLQLQCRVVAYIALAIREARAWLFTEHAEDYARTEIVWTLALGLPAAHSVGNRLAEIFKGLGAAAWTVAGSEFDISAKTCREALATRTSNADMDDVDVTVTPEIAAQVYGFVSSRSFDEKARNFFLIADVGAGTVDTCLFRVSRARGGRYAFEICTTAVEHAGVMNLHRHRVAWWQAQLKSSAAGCAYLSDELEKIKMPTCNLAPIPSSYMHYLEGVSVAFSGKARDPDTQFFRDPLLRQVQGTTLYRAVGDSLLGKQDVVDIPFFLCGGGSRLAFYQNLREALRRVEGCSWLKVREQELVLPDELRADGVGRLDYDRLSVAYGLSMLSTSGLSSMPPLPKASSDEPPDRWRSHYIDKDEC